MLSVTIEEGRESFAIVDKFMRLALDNELPFLEERVNKFYFVAQEIAYERDALVEKATQCSEALEREAQVVQRKLKKDGIVSSLSFNDPSSYSKELKEAMDKMEWLRTQVFMFSELVKVSFPDFF